MKFATTEFADMMLETKIRCSGETTVRLKMADVVFLLHAQRETIGGSLTTRGTLQKLSFLNTCKLHSVILPSAHQQLHTGEWQPLLFFFLHECTRAGCQLHALPTNKEDPS